MHRPAVFSHGVSVNHIHEEYDTSNNTTVIERIDSIKQKLMSYNVNGKHLITYLSNNFEKQ